MPQEPANFTVIIQNYTEEVRPIEDNTSGLRSRS